MMQISPETQLFIREHSSDDVRVLALQAKKYPDIDMPTAITQIAGRKVAAEKIPSWWEIEKIWYCLLYTSSLLSRDYWSYQ